VPQADALVKESFGLCSFWSALISGHSFPHTHSRSAVPSVVTTAKAVDSCKRMEKTLC